MPRTKQPNRKAKPADFVSAERNDGATEDGGIVVFGRTGTPLHYAPADVTRALRYAIGRLQTLEKGDVPACITVAGAAGGEGVTFVATSLAALLARDLKRTVCLVDLNWWSSHDADLHDPRTIDRLDQAPPGVAQILAGRLTLDEVLIPLMGRTITMLPAGPAALSELPVLARAQALAELIDELKMRFDHVVLDVPPILTTGEALSLATLADSFILVVRQGHTAHQQVTAALRELGHLTALGLIVNRSANHVPRRIADLLAD